MWSAAALLAGTVLAVSACSSSGGKAVSTVTVTGSDGKTTTSTSSGPSTSVSPSNTAKPGKPVHIKLTNSDGSTVGVGMPIIAYFTHTITNAVPFAKATQVTVNGTPAKGAWYFETSAAFKNYPIEGHFRLQDFWPAHATIRMKLPAKGLSAGTGLAFDDSLTLAFSTGAANISTVNDATHTLTVTTDGKPYGSFPVSLGAPATPTARGTKVIMEQGASICMSGPGYYECGVKDTQRLTYGGEYLHSAPWNVGNIGRLDSSNGCTNLLPGDAATLFRFLTVGDVVKYPNANGPKMQLGQGYGDWNVPWSQWQTGGLVPTR